MGEIVEGKVSITLAALKGSLTGSLRTNLSLVHLSSAARFSAALGRLELEHAESGWGPLFEEIQANASACVLLSVAALEAFANELFIDHRTYLPAVPQELIAQLWSDYERSAVLSKIDIALLLHGRPRLERGLPPAQDVDLLIRLRNALTHFKAEWTHEADEHAKLSARLRGRFSPTPFLSEPELLFPRRWASHGCTTWSVRAVLELVRALEASFGVPSRLDQFESRMVTT